MYGKSTLKEALLAENDLELAEVNDFSDHELDELPKHDVESPAVNDIQELGELPANVQRFLARAGLTKSDLHQVGLDVSDIQPMLKAAWLKYLRLAQVDNTLFKSLMLPMTRVWPRSKSVLFTSPWILRQAYITNDFIKGVQATATPLWSGVTYASIIMDWVNHATCPQGNKAEALLLFLGVSSRSQILSLLLSSKKTAYVPSLLFSLPLLWGSIKALIGALDARPLTKERAKAVIEALQRYQSHPWQDFGRWLLPFSALERNFNQLVRALTFDGRDIISADERYHMTIALTQRARDAKGFTQLYAMEGLAEIINGIALKDFAYLNKRFNRPTKAAVLFSKQQARATLRKLADEYRQTSNQSRLSPLVRYVYANYLLWYIGQPSALSLRPLFWATEGAKAYATLSILTALIRAAVEAIQHSANKNQCESAGKIYSFVDSIGDYACTVCADLVSYSNSLTDESCFNNFIRHPKPVQATLMAIKRFNLTKVNNLNLVLHHLSSEELGQVLQALNAKNATFDNLELYWKTSNHSKQTAAAIVQGLPALQPKRLKLRTQMIDDVMADAIERILSLKVLDLSVNDLTDEGLVALNGHYPPHLQELWLGYNQLSLSQVRLEPLLQTPIKILSLVHNKVPGDNLRKLYLQLKYSNLTTLSLPIVTGNYNATEAIEHLPWTTLQRLAVLSGYHDSQAVDALTQAVSRSQLTQLGITQAQFDIIDAQQFAERIMLPSLTRLDIAYSNLNDDVFMAMAPFLNRTQQLTGLSINISPLTDRGLSVLGRYLPQSNLHQIRLNGINITHIGVKALMQGAQVTKSLREIQLGYNHLNDDSALVIAKYLSPHLNNLELGNNHITGKGATVLADSLMFSNVSTLGITYNQLTDTGTLAFARRLSKLSNLTHLELIGNSISDTAIIELSTHLHNSSLNTLWLDKNNITDIGSINIARALIKPACQRPIAIGQHSAGLGTRRSNITSLSLAGNPILTTGTQALCKAMTVAQIPFEELIGDNNWQWTINTSLVDIKTCHILNVHPGQALASSQVSIDTNPVVTMPGKSTTQTKVLMQSVATVAVYGALGASVWYLASGLAKCWASKPKVYMPKEEVDLALLTFESQIKLLNTQLKSFGKYHLSKSSKKFLEYLKANLADSEEEHTGLENKRRVTTEQLKTLSDELEDIAYGIDELRQELKNQSTTPGAIDRLGLFATKPTSTCHSTVSGYYSYTL
jgi:Ran GTPase-activating protein (RanGAP) involved in mRNA processing and transport